MTNITRLISASITTLFIIFLFFAVPIQNVNAAEVWRGEYVIIPFPTQTISDSTKSGCETALADAISSSGSVVTSCYLFSSTGGTSGGGTGSVSGGITNPLKFDSISEFLNAILDVIILISVPIIILFIVYGGFKFISAQGNETKLSDAKRIIMYTLIGAVLILGAKVLAVAIQATVSELGAMGDSKVHLSLEKAPWQA